MLSATLIDLRPFCAASGVYGIEAPRLCGDWVVATTGSILIRCQPEFVAPFEPAEGRFLNSDSVMEAKQEVTGWEPRPLQSCVLCKNKGFTQPECERCHGAGWFACPTCEAEADCKHCDGHGVIDKPCSCAELPFPGGYHVRAAHAHAVNRLPGAMWQVDAPFNGPVYFQFEHGDGAVAAYKSKSES